MCNAPLRRLVLLVVFVLAGASVTKSARAASWQLSLAAELGTPSGYVQVRENKIAGTPLGLRGDLGVSTTYNLRLSAIRSFGRVSALHLWLGATQLTGSSRLLQRAYFNGVTLAPGPISSDTRFQDFWRLQATYWRKIVGFAGSGGLWLSAGLSFVSLNFRINAKIASDSTGHETKEDFNTQELPIPIFGIHIRYPLADGFSLFADLDGGHLPWTNSLRREGGMVQLTQTNTDALLGLRYRSSGAWLVRAYLFDYRYWQNERSAEDGNFVRINQHGVGLSVGYRF